MKRSTYITLFCGLLLGVCAGSVFAVDGNGPKSVRAGKFFYSVPEGVQDEWEYSMPECAPVPESNDFGIKDCGPFGKHQMCASSKSVELTNILTSQKRKFTLVYHLFDSKAACAKDRKEALKSH